jgi:hypothetical protein
MLPLSVQLNTRALCLHHMVGSAELATAKALMNSSDHVIVFLKLITDEFALKGSVVDPKVLRDIRERLSSLFGEPDDSHAGERDDQFRVILLHSGSLISISVHDGRFDGLELDESCRGLVLPPSFQTRLNSLPSASDLNSTLRKAGALAIR